MSKGHINGFQAGLNLYQNSSFQAGIYVGQLRGSMSTYGNAGGVMDKYVGSSSFNNNYVGLYATMLKDSGLYIDGVLQAARSKTHLDPENQSSRLHIKGKGWLASMEAGQAFYLNNQWSLEPQAQLIYQTSNFDDLTLGHATVKTKPGDQWTLRLGARLKGSLSTSAGGVQPYGRVNIFKSANSTDTNTFITPAETTVIKSHSGYTSTELAVGATWHINRQASVYAEVGKLWSNSGKSRVKSGAEALVGIKFSW